MTYVRDKEVVKIDSATKKNKTDDVCVAISHSAPFALAVQEGERRAPQSHRFGLISIPAFSRRRIALVEKSNERIEE